MTKENSFTQLFINETIQAVKMISVKNNESFCPHKAKKYMEKTLKDNVQKAFNEVQKDIKEANFGLETKKPTRIQLEVGKIAFIHAATLWGKEIFKHSKS